MAGTETIPRLTPEAIPDPLGEHEILPKMGAGLNGENIVDYAGELKDLATFREDFGYMRVYSRRPEEWVHLRSELRAEMGREAGLTLEEMQIGDALNDTVTWSEQLAASAPPDFAPTVQREGINRRTGAFETYHTSDNLNTYEKNKDALGHSLITLNNLVARYDLIARGEDPTEEAVAANSERAREITLSLLEQYKQRYEDILQGVENHELVVDTSEAALREGDETVLSQRREETFLYKDQLTKTIQTAKGMGHGHGGGHGHGHGHEEEINLNDYWARFKGVLGVGFDPNAALPVSPGPLRGLRQRAKLVTRKGLRDPDSNHWWYAPQHRFRHGKRVRERRAHMELLEERIADREHVIPQETYDRAQRRNAMLGAVISGDLFFEIPQNGNGNGNGYEEQVTNAGFTVETIPNGMIWRFGDSDRQENRQLLINDLDRRFDFITRRLDTLPTAGTHANALADRIGQRLQQLSALLNEGRDGYNMLDGDPTRTELIEEHALASARLIDWLVRADSRPDGVELYQYEQRNDDGDLIYNDVGYLFRDSDGNPIGVFWDDGSRAEWDADNDTVGARLNPTAKPFQPPEGLSPLVDPHIERLSQRKIDRRIRKGDSSLSLDEARTNQAQTLIDYDQTRTPETLETAWEASVKLAEIREVTAKDLVSRIAKLEGQTDPSAVTELNQARTDLATVLQESLGARREQAQFEAKRQGREVHEVDLKRTIAGLAITSRLGRQRTSPAEGRQATISADGASTTWGENVTIMTQDGPMTGEVTFNTDSVVVASGGTSRMYSLNGELIAVI